jgi:A/G-specific adenine glycosylase
MPPKPFSTNTRAGEGPEPIPPRLRQRIRRQLLPWFDRHQRELPWRRDRDPYRIWVSEVMLQQTQVTTVVGYFERFIQAFPTIRELAAASEQQVLRSWEGLGYYRRARHLHEAARKIVADCGGRIPQDPEVFGSLPGVGRYIRGAVLSQAYDRRLPILEANSRRVLCRLLGRKQDSDGTKGESWLWQAAEALLPKQRVGDFNQALMELGALVCTPNSPRCPVCPLRQCCEACRSGLQDEIPGRQSSPKEKTVQEVAVVVRRRNRVLLVQRPDKERWGGMWEFPHGEVSGEETHESAAARIAQELVGLRMKPGPELLTLRHSVMHYRILLTCFEACCPAGEFRSAFYQQGRWLYPSQLARFPVSAPQRRLALALIGPRQRRLF